MIVAVVIIILFYPIANCFLMVIFPIIIAWIIHLYIIQLLIEQCL